MNSTIAIAVLIADILVFTAFGIDVLTRFGVAANFSMTYYLYERLRKGLGLIFPALLLFICATTIPVWVLTTLQFTSCDPRFVICPYITLFGLLFVAITARYKVWPKLIYFHYACAIVAAVADALWLFLVAPRYCYICLAILSALLLAGYCTRTLRRTFWLWVEAACFYSMFFTLLLIHAIPLDI